MRDSGPTAVRHRDPDALRHRTSRPGPPRLAQDPALSHEDAVPTLSGHIAARFRDLMKAALVVAVMKDPDGRCLYANPCMLADVGELMGSDWNGKALGRLP